MKGQYTKKGWSKDVFKRIGEVFSTKPVMQQPKMAAK